MNRPVSCAVVLALLPMAGIVGCSGGSRRQVVVVIVAAEAPGYGADQVDDLVATPIASRLNGIPGVQRIRSRATAGKAVVWVDFASGTDVYKARQATAERLQLTASELPEAVVPRLRPVSVPDEVMLVALSTERDSPAQLRSVADGVVRPRLLAIPGVADVVVSFGPDMRNDAETFQGLSLRAASGETVALGQLAKVETVSVPRSLYRQQILRAILISCEVGSGDRAQAIAEIKRTVATYPLQADYHVEWD